MNGNQIVNVYDAAGRKLYSKTYTFLQQLAQPVTQVLQLEPELRHIKQATTVYNSNVTYTNVFGELVGYGTPQIHTIYNTEGYVMRQTFLQSYHQEYDYYYYRRDHLGNNVAVWNATADSTEQRTFYYATGLPMSCSTEQSFQNRKYNGKEYVEDHGFDVYDYGFRGYYATIGRFTSIDPLAEQTPWQSPYVYANNNFVNNVDQWGLFARSIAGFHTDISVPVLNWVAVDDDGNVVGWGDDEDDNHVYLVDEDWDGTYAGLAGYDIVGWEIRPAGFCGYIIGKPCYYLGSVTQGYWEGELIAKGTTQLMYGNNSVPFEESMGEWIYNGINAEIGIAGSITHNELYWRGKNGKWYSRTLRHKQGGYAYSYKVVGKSLKRIRNIGTILTIGSIAVEVNDILDTNSFQLSHAINIGLAGVSLGLTLASFGGLAALLTVGYFIVDTGFFIATGGDSLNDYTTVH